MWHFLKPWKRKNILKLHIFLFNFLSIYVTAREDAQVGNSVLDLDDGSPYVYRSLTRFLAVSWDTCIYSFFFFIYMDIYTFLNFFS